VLGIRRIATTSYHHASNGMLERWHKYLHTALSHYINAANTNWDTIAPFFLMAHRAQPHSVTGYSPFYLLHGREMQLPGNDNLKARCVQESMSLDRRIENLKSSLRMAYKEVAKLTEKHTKEIRDSTIAKQRRDILRKMTWCICIPLR